MMLFFHRVSITLYIYAHFLYITLATIIQMSKNTINSICNCQTRKKHYFPTCFEWIQVFVAFSVPISIGLYTFLQNNNDQAIALANREKDLEIARFQRAQDLQIASDQQKAAILAVYESFLVDHLNNYGMTLDGNSSARFVARLKTLTTISQLDPMRKTFLIQSLLEAKLIVNNNYNTSNPYDHVIISLKDADLSEISFENRDLKYLSLPKTNLTRATFVSTELSCVNFHSAILINANLHDATILKTKDQCFLNFSYTVFKEAIMTNANLFQAGFIATDFSSATLNHANMRYFVCIECLFVRTNMYQAGLSFSAITTNSDFQFTNLTEAILVSASFRHVSFVSTIFIRTQAAEANFNQCSFLSIKFLSCKLQQVLIVQSNFSDIYFNDVNLSKSILTNVNFINITMDHIDLTSTRFDQCTFVNVNFKNAIIINASFLNCVFQRSLITDEQRLQAASFDGSIFS